MYLKIMEGKWHSFIQIRKQNGNSKSHFRYFNCQYILFPPNLSTLRDNVFLTKFLCFPFKRLRSKSLSSLLVTQTRNPLSFQILPLLFLPFLYPNKVLGMSCRMNHVVCLCLKKENTNKTQMVTQLYTFNKLLP